MRQIIALSTVLLFSAFIGTHCLIATGLSSRTPLRNIIVRGCYSKLNRPFPNLQAHSNENEVVNGTREEKEFQPVSLPNHDSKWNHIPKDVLEDIGTLPEGSKVSLLNLEITTSDYYKSTRLVKGRSYARDTAFRKENIHEPPTLLDLTSPDHSSDYVDTLWTTNGYRFGVFLLAFIAFPAIVQFLKFQETIPLSMFGDLTDNFSTGVSVLYGTLISLTLSILYARQRSITEEISNESALLVVVARNYLALFQNDREKMISAGNFIADQIRILVKESRGKELMTLIYSDPYGRLLDLLNFGQISNTELVGNTRDVIQRCMLSRSKRLAGESSALPPTHFFILTLITGIILLSYTLSTLPSLSENGDPSFESRLFFALFVTVYVLFYNFAIDLNNPFGGVYQIRRSSVAANLLQTKRLLIHSPFLKDNINFDDDSNNS